jgi:hypothetical protein
VLGVLGETSVAPVAEVWVEDASEENQASQWIAIEVPGRLRVAGSEATILRALSNPNPLNEGWLKRISAVALARLGNTSSLEVLLDDANWFARLGVAEGLRELPPKLAHGLRKRVLADVDERVREAGRGK